MTTQQWLALPDDKLAIELGRVFTLEGEWKHDIFTGTASLPDFMCKKCDWTCTIGAMADFTGDGLVVKESGKFILLHIDNPQERLLLSSGGHQYKSHCPVPDPIKLDWNTAMEWFRQHSPSRTILRQVCGSVPIDCVSWFLVSAQPSDYLKAAAIAAERNKK